MRISSPLRVAAAAIAIALFLGACASAGSSDGGPPAPAPQYRVGDRWVYHIVDGYRQKIIWDETHEVVAMGPEGITVKVTAIGNFNGERIEKWSAPGIVLQGAVYEDETSRFDPPLVRYQYPLASGERWSQRMQDLDKPSAPFGGISRSVSVRGHEQITTAAGTFDAIRIDIIMQMDDETFWRWPTQCTYSLWYAPAVGAMVREQKRSEWRDKGGYDATAYHPGQNAVIELISHTRGG